MGLPQASTSFSRLYVSVKVGLSVETQQLFSYCTFTQIICKESSIADTTLFYYYTDLVQSLLSNLSIAVPKWTAVGPIF